MPFFNEIINIKEDEAYKKIEERPPIASDMLSQRLIEGFLEPQLTQLISALNSYLKV